MTLTSVAACADKVAFPTNYVGRQQAQETLALMLAKHDPSSTRGLIMYVCNNRTHPSIEKGEHIHLGRNALLG